MIKKRDIVLFVIDYASKKVFGNTKERGMKLSEIQKYVHRIQNGIKENFKLDLGYEFQSSILYSVYSRELTQDLLTWETIGALAEFKHLGHEKSYLITSIGRGYVRSSNGPINKIRDCIGEEGFNYVNGIVKSIPATK
jgi:uncharacterized protein YwgA